MQIKWNKKYFEIVFLVVVFGLTLWSVFGGEDLRGTIECMADADPLYIVLSIICVVLFILGESLVIFYLMRTLGDRVAFSHCCHYSFLGFFDSCITPSASGGQPMQVVAMRKDDIPIPVATVVLAIVTVTYKLVLVVMGVGVLCVHPPRVMEYLDPVISVVYLGLALNVVCIVGLLLLVFHDSGVKKIALRVVYFIHKVHPFRNLKKQLDRVERMTSQYQGTASFFRTHKHVIVHAFLITVVQRVLLFSIAWFTYRAFGLEQESFGLIVTLQAMISVAVDMLPLPGGMGISETLFLRIFEPIFGATLILPGMVINRGISYYTQLFISGGMTLAASFIIKEKNSVQKEEKAA